MSVEFKNFHAGTDWSYEEDGTSWIKVGTHGINDEEHIVQSDGLIYIPEAQRYFPTLQIAYTRLNEEWIEMEELYLLIPQRIKYVI